jgi:cytochrome c oxidase cbb3-type subunit 1
MNPQSPSTITYGAESRATGSATISTAEIDRSCRMAVMFLFTSALLWLVFGLVLGLISSIKLHGAGFLSGPSWLTYGRIYPASQNALVYGFTAQAFIGMALWLLARLSRASLQGSGMIIVGGLFWNLGVAIGLFGILAGQNTGYQWLEMPGYASALLFFSYAFIGIWALITFHIRRERSLYVSQWYLVAALLWFPWIYSTAQLLLVVWPVRGVMQAVVNGWFAHNLFEVWFASLGLAAIYYFVPKVLGQPLYSRNLALFAFWVLAIFGSWGGMYAGAPVPKWVSSLSIVTRVMMLIPVLAIALNLHRTMGMKSGMKCAALKTSIVLRFVLAGAFCYLLSNLLGIAGALRSVNEVTLFTVYELAETNLHLYGFLGLVVVGGIYYIVPRIAESEWPSAGMIRFHFWTAVAGVALMVVPLVLGGILQGFKLNDAQVPFLSVVRSTIPFLGMSTLGGLLLLAGSAALLINVIKILPACCGCCCPKVSNSAMPSKPVAVGGRV